MDVVTHSWRSKNNDSDAAVAQSFWSWVLSKHFGDDFNKTVTLKFEGGHYQHAVPHIETRLPNMRKRLPAKDFSGTITFHCCRGMPRDMVIKTV